MGCLAPWGWGLKLQVVRTLRQEVLHHCVYLKAYMRPLVVPLGCNIDVTSLKVKSQMTRYSMIQTI